MFLNDEIIGTCIGQFHWRSLGWFEEISWATAKFQVYFEICTDLAWCKTNIPNLWKQRSFILRCSSIFLTMTLDVNLIVDMFVWCTRRLTIHWTKRIIGFRGWVELGTKGATGFPATTRKRIFAVGSGCRRFATITQIHLNRFKPFRIS